MLIQGTPDILKPPRTALLSGLDITNDLPDDESLVNYAWLASIIPLSVVDKIEIELTGSPDWLVGLRIFKLYAVPYELEMPMIMTAFGMDPAESVTFLDEIMDRGGVMYELLKKPNIESRNMIQTYADKHGWTDEFIASVGRISVENYRAWVSESQASPSEPPFAGGITVPSDLGQRSIGGKVEWYRKQRESFTDLQVKMAVERFVGPQTDEDWYALKYLSNIPPYIITSSPGKKAAIYRSLLQRFTDDEIRRMVSLVIGPQSNSDWGALIALASRTPVLPHRVVNVVAAPVASPAPPTAAPAPPVIWVASPAPPTAAPVPPVIVVNLDDFEATLPSEVKTETRAVPVVVDDSQSGAPAMIQLPANLGTMTEAQKIAWYRATLAAGNTDAAIRSAVEATYGRQSDSSWTYLRAKAAQTDGAAGGAGLLLAAAAYFLLG